jgi:hypothetical protein
MHFIRAAVVSDLETASVPGDVLAASDAATSRMRISGIRASGVRLREEGTR